MPYNEIDMDMTKEGLEQPSKWIIECTEHGNQEVEPGTLHQWDEETEALLRAEGLLAEGKHFCTGNCPICHTTREAIEENTQLPTSTYT